MEPQFEQVREGAAIPNTAPPAADGASPTQAAPSRSEKLKPPKDLTRLASEYGIETQQCKATSRSGERCKTAAIPGLSVCRWHGGSTKSARRKAARVLERGSLPAAAKLMQLMEKAKDQKLQAWCATKILSYALPKAAQHLMVSGTIDHNITDHNLDLLIASLSQRVFGLTPDKIGEIQATLQPALPAPAAIPAEFSVVAESETVQAE